MHNKIRNILFVLFLSINILAVPGPVFCIDEEKIISDYLWQKAREIPRGERPRVALVLGGGGARGLAHIGVIKVMEEEKVPVDMVVGTSVGALVGALYASGISMGQIENIGEEVRWNKLTNFNAVSLIKLIISQRLLSTEKMQAYLSSTIGDKWFYQLDKSLACVATDINTGEAVVLREGSVAFAARASATIPGVFSPVEFRHRYLVDGGLSANIPAGIAKILGADLIIASAVSSDFSNKNISNVLMTLIQSIYIQGSLLDRDNLKYADVVITPRVGEISAIDLGRSDDCIDAGIVAARKELPNIKRSIIGSIDEEKLFR